jgi:hypothetical protein
MLFLKDNSSLNVDFETDSSPVNMQKRFHSRGRIGGIKTSIRKTKNQPLHFAEVYRNNAIKGILRENSKEK